MTSAGILLTGLCWEEWHAAGVFMSRSFSLAYKLGGGGEGEDRPPPSSSSHIGYLPFMRNNQPAGRHPLLAKGLGPTLVQLAAAAGDPRQKKFFYASATVFDMSLPP